MINFANNGNNGVVADNKVLIGGLEYLLTDDEAIKVNDIIKGMISTRGQSKSLQQTTTKFVAPSEPKKSTSKDFPDLGKAVETIGFVSRYDGNAVRYWENGYCPNKVKYGIKMSLKDAGAEWNKDKGAFVFKTKKACDEYMKAQKARKAK